MNKKFIALLTTTLLTTSLLVGCNQSNDSKDTNNTETKQETTQSNQENTAPLKDGTYSAKFAKGDKYGWTAFVEIKVKDGKITETNADYINSKGDLKSKDVEYENKMKESTKEKIYPAKISEDFNKSLVEKQNPETVDNITGATESTKQFRKLAKAAITASQDGDKTEVIVEN